MLSLASTYRVLQRQKMFLISEGRGEWPRIEIWYLRQPVILCCCNTAQISHVLSALRARSQVAFCALIVFSTLWISFSFSGQTSIFARSFTPDTGADSFDSKPCNSVRHFCSGPSVSLSSFSRFNKRTSLGEFALRARSSRLNSTLLRLFSSSIILLTSFRHSLTLPRYL